MPNCAYCQAETENKKYCSLSCSNKNRPKALPKIKSTNICITCGKNTNNPKYCNRSCAAISNNGIKPKRKAEIRNCLDCGEVCSNVDQTHRCINCHKQNLHNKSLKRISDYGSKSLQECVDFALKYRASKHKYELIRSHAHRASRVLKWETSKCESCGWDKHTELCHKKPISHFSTDSLLSEINSKENIAFLCPNCHWLLDHYIIPTVNRVISEYAPLCCH